MGAGIRKLILAPVILENIYQLFRKKSEFLNIIVTRSAIL